jgi:hypothetical protein
MAVPRHPVLIASQLKTMDCTSASKPDFLGGKRGEDLYSAATLGFFDLDPRANTGARNCPV